jgi:hypothetical protein
VLPDRTQLLEQALLAVIASATRMGVSCDALCAEAVGGLMADQHWKWADPQYRQGLLTRLISYNYAFESGVSASSQICFHSGNSGFMNWNTRL